MYFGTKNYLKSTRNHTANTRYKMQIFLLRIKVSYAPSQSLASIPFLAVTIVIPQDQCLATIKLYA
jgi:hypothetical protein